MPGAVIQNPISPWLRPENASVTDTALTKAMRMIGHLIGADNPTAQVLGLMMTEVPGGSATGGLAKAVEGLKARVIKAYHGSPHDFERFSLEKIGTGEGAQAYGHGLYFAENPEVAGQYRASLTARKGIDAEPSYLVGSEVVKPTTSDHMEILHTIAHAQANQNDAADVLRRNAQEALDAARTTPLLRSENPRMLDLAQRTITEYEQRLKLIDELMAQPVKVDPAKGRTYEVAIHADPEDFLDWDKPLSQQSEKAKRALEKVGALPSGYGEYEQVIGKMNAIAARPAAEHQTNPALLTEWDKLNRDRNRLIARFGPHPLSQKIQRNAVQGEDVLANAVKNPETTTKLKSEGIPGIKYLDQGSRAAGEGSRNYVVFDDRLIDILKKYGLLLPAAGGAGQATIARRSE